jgi:hypothetical protein
MFSAGPPRQCNSHRCLLVGRPHTSVPCWQAVLIARGQRAPRLKSHYAVWKVQGIFGVAVVVWNVSVKKVVYVPIILFRGFQLFLHSCYACPSILVYPTLSTNINEAGINSFKTDICLNWKSFRTSQRTQFVSIVLVKTNMLIHAWGLLFVATVTRNALIRETFCDTRVITGAYNVTSELRKVTC